jgi:hypothetical protein
LRVGSACSDATDKDPDEIDIAFIAETIHNFKQNLPEPWTVIAGMTPNLESAKREAVLEKAVYFPHGAIELEPRPLDENRMRPINQVSTSGVGQQSDRVVAVVAHRLLFCYCVRPHE